MPADISNEGNKTRNVSAIATQTLRTIVTRSWLPCPATPLMRTHYDLSPIRGIALATESPLIQEVQLIEVRMPAGMRLRIEDHNLALIPGE